MVILTLALGIGANRGDVQPPERRPAEILARLESRGAGAARGGPWTNPIWEHVRDQQGALAGGLAFGDRRLDLAQGGERDLVDGVLASGGYFDVLGVRALVGRTFAIEEDRRGCGAATLVLALVVLAAGSLSPRGADRCGGAPARRVDPF